MPYEYTHIIHIYICTSFIHIDAVNSFTVYVYVLFICVSGLGMSNIKAPMDIRYQVCVKVQHHGVGNLMKTDLVTIEFIAAKMMKLHKGAADFTVPLP